MGKLLRNVSCYARLIGILIFEGGKHAFRLDGFEKLFVEDVDSNRLQFIIEST